MMLIMSLPTPTPTQTTAPPRRRRRWWIALGFVAAMLLVPVGWMVVNHFTTQGAWDAAVAEAEQDLPRWRLLELEADRAVLPANENSALHIIAVNRARGKIQVGDGPHYEQI